MHKDFMRFLLSLIISSIIMPGAFSQERYSKIRIPVSSREEIINLSRLGFDLEGARPGAKKEIDLFVTEWQKEILKANAISFTTLIEDWSQYYRERQRAETRLAKELLSESEVRNFHLGSMGGFLTLKELAADLDSMHSKYPNLITVKDSIGASFEKRPMWAVKISGGGSAARPQALFLAVHHAREPIGIMVLTYFMWYLLEQYGVDPEVTTLLDTRELHFIPLVNPD